MRGLGMLIGVVACMLLISNCKKADIHVNAEKVFYFYTVDSTNAATNICFDSIRGHGRPLFTNSCSNFKEGVNLPLDISSNKSIFYFYKSGRTDTLSIYYNAYPVKGDKEFEINYRITRVAGTFANPISLKCVPNVTYLCYGNDAYMSASVLY